MTNSFLSIATVSEQTGLGKEVLRKWEVRYGFPAPERDAIGRRQFSAAQVMRLQAIKSLLDGGMRARQVVPLELPALLALVAEARPRGTASEPATEERLLERMRSDDPSAVRLFLDTELAGLGLRAFVTNLLPSLNTLVGNAWADGRIGARNEHLYTESVKSLLNEQLATLPGTNSGPRVLLATATGELHTLGLLMAEVILTLEGARCISLGANLPCEEIVLAAAQYRAEIVGLSFSEAFSIKKLQAFLAQCRAALPATMELWAGGTGVSRLEQPATGVLSVPSMEDAVTALTQYRAKTMTVAS